MSDRVFVVVRGPALSGKTAVARALAASFLNEGPGKVAVISQDDLWERWIVGHDPDLARETELIYRQLKLLSATYIRSGYHVVVDAMFAAHRDGVAATHESDLRELLGLVSTIRNVRPLLVNVTAPLETLIERSRQSERWDASAVESLSRAFEAGALPSPLVLDTSALSVEQAIERILAQLGVRA